MDARKNQRKSYSMEFKVKVTLEVIKGQRTVNEIASQYRVHPNQVAQWKRQAIESRKPSVIRRDLQKIIVQPVNQTRSHPKTG